MAGKSKQQKTIVVNGKEYPAEIVELAQRLSQQVDCEVEAAIRAILRDRERTQMAKPADPDEPIRIYLGFGNQLRGRR